jgi:SAM-dependent methyltransferase
MPPESALDTVAVVRDRHGMSSQQWNAADYASNARFVSDLGAPVLDLLQPRAGERILDVGCGDGALTAAIAAAGAGVLGVDTASEMLAAARARGLDVHAADARQLPFHAEFDAVFTNAVLHWVPDLEPVLHGVRRALRPQGRFVGEFGGHGCVAAVCTALRAVASARGIGLALPWNFMTGDDFEDALRAAGFTPVLVRIVPRPTLLPSGMAAWLRTFAGWAFDALPAAQRDAAFDAVVELLRPSLCDSRGRWTADYVRLRFAART